jgi:hypothetical protein
MPTSSFDVFFNGCLLSELLALYEKECRKHRMGAYRSAGAVRSDRQPAFLGGCFAAQREQAPSPQRESLRLMN